MVYFIFIFSFYKLVSLLIQSKKQEKNVSSGTSSKNESYYGSLYIIPYMYSYFCTEIEVNTLYSHLSLKLGSIATYLDQQNKCLCHLCP